MRLPLTMMEVFVAIARHGSLRGAADALGLKPSTVSHQLKGLEERLEAPLFVRTTRALSLTESGRALLRGAGPAFDQLASAVESARTTGHSARGHLKLAMPDFVYQLIVGPALPSFSQRYPEIEVELSVSDAFSDLLGEELHAGFRLGDRITQDMVAVRLTPSLPLAVVGSPDYLARAGVPETPTDLLNHHCIRYRFQTSGRFYVWTFEGTDGSYSVNVKGPLVGSSLPVVVDLAERGGGLVYTFRDICAAQIAAGTLVPVLEKDTLTVPGVFLYFPQEYRGMVPLRLFRDHLRGFADRIPS